MSERSPAPGFDPARHCEVMAPALGLVVTEAQMPAVLQFLGIAHAMSELVATAPVNDASLELAPVFRPGAPEDRA